MDNTEILKTPVGVLRFGSLFDKDQFDRYSAGVAFDTAQFKDIGAFLKHMQDRHVQLNPKVQPAPFYKPAKDADGNPEPGKLLLTFKSGFPVAVVDSSGKKLKTANVGSGSEVRIAFKPVMQEAQGKAYVALYLSAVQIIKLVEYDPNPFASDAVEGGYVAGVDLDEAPQSAGKPFNDDIPW